MTPALIHAVVRVADARTSDTDLLKRFVHSRDEHAFEELVRRHGPLVWAVCRQLLLHHADAEDAFQAVFLALIQGAGSIRSGQVLAAWLHGVAVRIAEKTKRASCRRRTREARAAVLERDQPVPDIAWAALMSAVHEEVQRLPEQERTAFVLCDLEGVRQSDAAIRLGWPLGTLSGRLCKARQRLIHQLTRRGVVPGVLAIGGLVATTGEVPASLAAKVSSFPLALADGISSTVGSLAHGVVGGATMRTKVLVAALLVAGAVGLSGASMFFSNADAQADPFKVAGSGQQGAPGGDQPGNPGAQPPAVPGRGPLGIPGGQPPIPTQGLPEVGGPGTQGVHPPGQTQGLPGPGGPGAMPGGPAMGGSMGPERAAFQWDYKFIDLKNDDRDAFEKEIRQAGTQGWEFCGSEHLRKGSENMLKLVLVFKKKHGADLTPWGMPGLPPSGMGGGMPPGWPMGGAPGMVPTPAMGGPGKGPAPAGIGPVMPPQGPTAGTGNPAGQQPPTGARTTRTVKLNHTDAVLVTTFLNAYLKGQNQDAVVVADPASNTILVAANPDLLKQLTQLISDLDTALEKGTGPAARGPRTGSNTGPLLPGVPAKTGTMPSTGSAGPSRGELTVIKLKHAKAEELSQVLLRVFSSMEITPDQRTNQLIIRTHADQESEMIRMQKLIVELDVESSKR